MAQLRLVIRRWWFSALFWVLFVGPVAIGALLGDTRWWGAISSVLGPGSVLIRGLFAGAMKRGMRLPGERTLKFLAPVFPPLETWQRNEEIKRANQQLLDRMRTALAPYDLAVPQTLDTRLAQLCVDARGEIQPLDVAACAGHVATELLPVVAGVVPGTVDRELLAAALELIYHDCHGPREATGFARARDGRPVDRGDLIALLAALALRHYLLREATSGQRHEQAAVAAKLAHKTGFDVANLAADLREAPLAAAKHIQWVLDRYGLGTLPDDKLDALAVELEGRAEVDLPQAAAEHVLKASHTHASAELIELLYRYHSHRTTERVWRKCREAAHGGPGLAAQLGTVLAQHAAELLPPTRRVFTADELTDILVQLDEMDLKGVDKIVVRLDDACTLAGEFAAFMRRNGFAAVVDPEVFYRRTAKTALGRWAAGDDACVRSRLDLLRDHAERWVAGAPVAAGPLTRALAAVAVGRFLDGDPLADLSLRSRWSRDTALSADADDVARMLFASIWRRQGGLGERPQPVRLYDLAVHWREWRAAAVDVSGADEIRHIEAELLERMRQGLWPGVLPAVYREAARVREHITGAVAGLRASVDDLQAAFPPVDRQRLDVLLARSDELERAVKRFDVMAPVTASVPQWAHAPQLRHYVLTFGSAGPLAKLVDCLAQPSDEQRARLTKCGVRLEVQGPQGMEPVYVFTRYTRLTREGRLPAGCDFEDWWKLFCAAFNVVVKERARLLPDWAAKGRVLRDAQITAQLIAEPHRGDYRIKVIVPPPKRPGSHAQRDPVKPVAPAAERPAVAVAGASEGIARDRQPA